MALHPFFKESSVLKLILGLFVFIITVSIIVCLSETTSNYPEEAKYIGVLTTSSDKTAYFMGIVSDIETDTLRVVLTELNGWKNQSRCMIIIPPDTTNISFLTMQGKIPPVIPEKIVESSYASRIPYSSYENLSLAREKGLLVVKPDKIKDYYGIEFYLHGLIRHPSLSQIIFVVPLYYSGEGISPELHEVTLYKTQVRIPRNYDLISSVPASSRFKVSGDNLAIYEFNADPSGSDLLLNLENRFITRSISNIQILLGTLVGFSTSLIITQSIDLISRKEEIRLNIRKRREGKGELDENECKDDAEAKLTSDSDDEESY
ncbi:MAG TPA: hypothetical protein VN372_07230 [Methanospirillum sp.]|nr:hypothetical protein [Methanospirillum sp.]